MGYYERVFSRVDYRILIALPPVIALLLLPAAIHIPLGIDFTGGTELQILTNRDLTESQLRSALSTCASDMSIHLQELGGKSSAIIRTKDEMTKECVDSALGEAGFTDEELSSIFPSVFKPELGRILIERGTNVIIIAGILMSIIVFLAFRSPVPSIAVIQAAIFDILIALGLLSLIGFELNLAGVAALLMLVGYSIDTDIMLTSKILGQSNKPFGERANQAFVTGITMTGTTLAAMSAIVIVTGFIHMDTIVQIATVLLTGLLADLATTWFTNLGILKWYASRSKSGYHRFRFSIFRS